MIFPGEAFPARRRQNFLRKIIARLKFGQSFQRGKGKFQERVHSECRVSDI